MRVTERENGGSGGGNAVGGATCHFLLTDGPLARADSPVAVISFRHPALFTSL